MKFVFKLNDNIDHDIIKKDELYIGEYQQNAIDNNLVIHLFSDIQQEDILNIKVPQNILEKLYTWE